MNYKVVFVTTFYNEYERLKFTLSHMLKQDTENFVHLIIDDGSKGNSADELVQDYARRAKHRVVFEKHANAGINRVHMEAFARTPEFDGTHFMWLDCGDGLAENAVSVINKTIEANPNAWLHLDGYNMRNGEACERMSSRSYLPYLKMTDQFLPFCFSVSTYGHFVIPFEAYRELNPDFRLVDGFYYDAQIIGALSLNSRPQYFVREPLSRIEDDQHFSVANSPQNTYRDNLLKLSEFVVADRVVRERAADISAGMNLISIRRLVKGKSYFENRRNIIELKRFYKSNGIKVTDRYKWLALAFISLLHFC